MPITPPAVKRSSPFRGGQTVIGSAGYVQAIPEIMRQMEQQHISAKYLVVGYGSTGTFCRAVGRRQGYYHAPFEVIGIPIEPDYRPVEETVDFINELSHTFEMGFTCTAQDLHLEFGPAERSYGGVGYNEPDSVTERCIELLAKTEAIFLDPCYTGKVFHGFLDLLRRGVISGADGAIFFAYRRRTGSLDPGAPDATQSPSGRMRKRTASM